MVLRQVSGDLPELCPSLDLFGCCGRRKELDLGIFFNEQAETLLGGVTADDAYAKTYADGHDQDAYDSYFAKAMHTEWIFRCKVKNEMVNDESRVKTSVVSLHPVDYAKESRDLLAEIEKF